MSRILLENLNKIYENGITAVSDFSLDIHEGCFMVIVGPSGCGKTTTLRLIAGLEKPDSGKISIGENSVIEAPANERNVSMVFQNYVLYPHMNVYQNMAFALKMRKTPRKQIKKVIKETAALLGIEELLRRKPRSLSGGQRQRVALGKAIVREPSAFLFDEPLSNLDAKMRLTMRSQIKELQQKLKTTTVYVTHDQVEAMTLGEQVCVMNDGKIQQIGKPMEIYDKPANKFVAGFFGTPPMNFLNGNIKIINEIISFVFGKNILSLPNKYIRYFENSHEKEIVLGVRPEDISIGFCENGQYETLKATVIGIEKVGNRTDISFQMGNEYNFVMSTSPDIDFYLEQEVEIHINLDKIHLFEHSITGRNIIYPEN